MAKNVLVLLLFVALFGAGFWLLRDADQTGSQAPVQHAQSFAEPVAERQSASAAVADSARDPVVVEAAEPRAEGEPPSERAPSTIQGAARALFVVDRQSGAPVVDAAVYQISETQFESDFPGQYRLPFGALLAEILGRGFEAVAPDLERAALFRTGANGQVLVEDTVNPTLIVVVGEGRRGYGIVGGLRDTGDTLEVAQPASLTVRTVTATGAEAPMVGFSMRGLMMGLKLLEFRTNARGRWELFEVNTLVEPFNRKLAPDSLDVDDVRIGRAIAPPASAVPVDLRTGGSYELVVGNGSAIVSVVDAEGLPPRSILRQVFLDGADGSLVGHLDLQGQAYFRGLIVGTAVSARLIQSPMQSDPLPEPVHGVVGAEPLELRLVLPKGEQHDLQLRALDGTRAGAPIASTSLWVTVALDHGTGGKQSSSQPVTTDAEGLVRWEPPILKSSIPAGTSLTVTAKLETPAGPLRATTQALVGPAPLPHDFGELVLVLERPFVAGHVVDANGAPVDLAQVQLSYHDEGTARFDPDLGAFAITAEDGSFAFFGTSLNTDWSLVGKHAKFGQSVPVAFEPGATNVRIELSSMGAIVMTTSAADRATASQYKVWLRPSGADFGPEFKPSADGSGWLSSNNTDGFGSHFDAEGELTWRELLPGSYRVRVMKSGELLMTIDDVLVVGGQPTRDPRLLAMQLGALLQRVTLEVVDQAGAPIEPVKLQFDGDSDPQPLVAGEVAVAALGADAQVMSPGYMTEQVVLATTHEVVVLRKAPSVTLQFPVAFEPTDAVSYKAVVVPKALRNFPLTPSTFQRPLKGYAVEVPIEALGAQRIMIEVTRQTGPGMSSVSYEQLAFALELDESCAGQVIEVALTEKERAALQL